ncbi:sensor domain-containing diguanylate cyclase [Jiella sonneratiae]|uniref:diguanylate cyclase n=1 Tax=Jiella sonneratiae TaxID=2816856 RepID=A0ABS3J157_9HYPH|nr:diguanylate cyclase [Jiella sonneratiae]MBO0902827.1 diguanylate cyclase [Jiella sonneratiae]
MDKALTRNNSCTVGGGAPRIGLPRSAVISEYAPDATLIAANDDFLALTQYRAEEVLGRPHGFFMVPEDRDDPQYPAMWEALRAGEFMQKESRRLLRDGREVWVQASYTPVFAEDGTVKSVIEMATDVTAAKRRAANHETILAAISRSTAMAEFAMDGTILAANSNYGELIGCPPADLLGRNHFDFVTTGDAQDNAALAFWTRLRCGQCIQADVFSTIADGRRVWMQASYTPVLDASGCPVKVMKIATDITGRMERNAEAERLALLDPLTGVSNRRGFDLALAAAMSEHGSAGGGPIALLLLDVDHFKAFNDTFGHQIGDRCLRTIAETIERVVQGPESLVARYGGEEFAVLLPNCSESEAARIAEVVRAEVQKLCIEHAGNPGWCVVTVSTGVATLGQAGDGSAGGSALVAAADAALYAAKRQGRNRVIDAGAMLPRTGRLAAAG